ncbi:N-acetylmuramoyl-L-alanine amidase [Faecalicatena contorta]|uniref:N-acetylmuramoyl-L-alanine amidase n=1 Tax=Faecalicatena contorta TaxID=39482 RepID=A0A315ZVV6_9FIRM|nr:N-acetylmuramoyl-L-alanine amidase [Faecalicatena contorta]PWJ49363.1 N-acetylmuramoyl-L-alanine amidase [Faecalicatena contorta]SUQ14607.1 N-acetylmuramoyl-L-alanine amidase [Faecalicatena contorta]
MKIGLRGGHSPNCKGAMGILDEQAEVRKIYNEMVPMLQAAGHTVINCNSDSSTVNGELSEGTNKANANNCDIYVTIHMNASNGNGRGTEVFLYNNENLMMNQRAGNICNKFAQAGFPNRGVKFNTGYHDLNASRMPAMIVETIFCDNQHDADLYRKMGAKGIAELIVNGITGKSAESIKPTSQAAETPSQNPGKSTNNFGLWYRAHVEKLGWLPAVHDGQVAGTTGHGLRLEALKIDTRKLPGVKIKASAHIQSKGTVDYGYITHETVIGTTGQKKRLEAIMLDVEGLEGKKLYVQMHFHKDGWGNAVAGGDGGSFGISKETQAVKMWIA